MRQSGRYLSEYRVLAVWVQKRPLCGALVFSSTIAQLVNAFLFGAMCTAEDRIVFFNAMTDNVCATSRASWCERLDCALKAIECVGAAIHSHPERFVVIVSASFAYWHCSAPRNRWLAAKVGACELSSRGIRMSVRGTPGN